MGGDQGANVNSVPFTGDDAPLLLLPRATKQHALTEIDLNAAPKFSGLDLNMMTGPVDAELAEHILDFCGALSSAGGGCPTLRLAHVDLGSGTDCEQRLFTLRAERELRQNEKAFHQKKKHDSSKQKDFAASAQMRNAAEAGMSAAQARLDEIDGELAALEKQQLEAPWHCLFSGMQVPGRRNALRHLDLSDCGLHATGLQVLVRVLLEFEQRADDEKVTRLSLDGNDLGDMAMGAVALLLRLSGHLEALFLRNVGLTDQGMSQVLSSLVANKCTRLVDLRSNGLCSPEVGQAALTGVRRFNTTAEVLLV